MLASFAVGACGVIVPFFVGYYVFTSFGIGALQSVLIATALTATSIAISVRVLSDLGRMQTEEAKLILGAAIVDDILAIAILSVVTTMVQTGNMTPDVFDITFLILKILGIFLRYSLEPYTLYQKYYTQKDYGNLGEVLKVLLLHHSLGRLE